MTEPQKSVEDWLDSLCLAWRAIEVDRGVQLTSYLVFARNELPGSAILAANAPCVATYVDDCQIELSDGVNILHWYGTSEFHLTKDVKPSNVPFVMRFYKKIIAVAAANFMLRGLATSNGGDGGHFTILRKTPGAMAFTTYLHPVTGNPDHQGISVRWYANQNVGGGYPLS